jgi:8-oxo-dGTP pyrophosphatase MutT (NUDIX family)
METLKAAVSLIYLKSSCEFLVVRRSSHPQDPWSYQMALPGGKREQNESLIETAQRETYEECSIYLDQPVASLRPQMAGKFSKYTIKVQPYLFVLDTKPNIVLEKKELSAYYWIPIKHFQSPKHHSKKIMSKSHPNIEFPTYEVDKNHIWGFTYSVLVNHFNQKPKDCLKEQLIQISLLENH